jgi:hypothetical protein
MMESDDLVEQGGELYRRITSKEAFDLRLDVQLYTLNASATVIVPDPESPEEWRIRLEMSFGVGPYFSFNNNYWTDRKLLWFVKVDPDRPEYVPCG